MEEREREELIRVARGDIPARYADPLWITVAPDGGEAVVVLGITEEPYDDLEEVECFRERGRWHAASSSNGLGFGWTPRGRSADGSTFTGLLRLSGEAPDGVEAVVVRWNGRDREVPVTSGYFFFGVWEVQEDFDDASGYPHVLAHIKEDPDLRRIPVVIMTTSSAEQDIFEAYNLHANCYVTKPIELDDFIGAVRKIEDFWLTIVKLPAA